jgi:hypothetical protein
MIPVLPGSFPEERLLILLAQDKHLFYNIAALHYFAIEIRLLPVIKLLRHHSSFASGVEFVITLMNIPVPTPSPQFPWVPQKPPKIFSARLRATEIFVDLL